MDIGRRSVVSIKAKDPVVGSLRALAARLPLNRVKPFENNHGKLLDILATSIDSDLVGALIRFYDSSLRCFTFQDYQWAPILEEFALLIGIPIGDEPVFSGLVKPLDHQEIATALYWDKKSVTASLETKAKSFGFPRGTLEARANECIEKKDWKAFYATLALLIYGIILFPEAEDFINASAISVFLTKNRVPTLLADVYYCLTLRHSKKDGVVMCCTALLQMWFKEHLPKTSAFSYNKYNLRWAQRIVNLTEQDIDWYDSAYDGIEIIMSCGDFPNVPLIGTKGLINYNPVLARRQLGYIMEGPPEEESVTEIISYGIEESDLLKKFRKAWKTIHRHDREKMGRKVPFAKEPYQIWVKARAREVKFPFSVSLPAWPKTPEPEPATREEIDEWKAKHALLMKEKEDLESKLNKSTSDNFSFKRTLEENHKTLDETRMKVKEEEEFKKKYYQEKTTAESCMKRLRRNLKDTQQERGEAYRWMDLAIEEK